MSKFQLTSPEGKTYEINGPEGATPEQAFGILQSHIGTPAAEAQGARDTAAARTQRSVRSPVRAHPMEPGLSVTDAYKGAKQYVAGANEGLGDVLTALPDLVGKGTKALTGYEPPSSREAWHGFFTGGTPKPETPGQEILRGAGHMTGENMPLLVGGMGLANSGSRAAVPLAEQAGSFVKTAKGAADTALDWIKGHPGTWATGNVVGPTEASIGGDVAERAAVNSGAEPGGSAAQGAKVAGQFLFPPTAGLYSKFGPPALAARGAAKVGNAALDTVARAPGGLENMLPEFMRRGPSAADQMAERLQWANREGKYTNPSEPQPPEPSWATRRIAEGQARDAASTNAKVGKDIRAINAVPENAERAAEAAGVKQEIPGFNPTMPKETGDQGLVNLQHDIERKATGDELRGMQGRTDKSAQAIRDYAEGQVPAAGAHPEDVVHRAAQARVAGVNQRIEGQQQAAEGELARRSDLPEADVSNIGHQMRRVRSAEEQASEARVNQLRNQIAMPDRQVTLQHPQTGEPVQTTLRAAMERRAQINQDLRDYYSANTRDQRDVRSIRRLQGERDAIESAIGDVNDPGFQEFNRYYREEHVPRFLEGASRDVGRYGQTGYGKNKVADEDVAGKFFGPNNVSEARQWNRLYGDTPEMRQQMTDYALDDLRRTSTDPRTGMLREGAVDTWLHKNGRILNEMPWIREAVTARNPNELYGRMSQLEGRETQVAKGKLGSVLGKNGTPEATVDAAMKDWQLMRGLKRSVQGNEAGERALTKAVWDRAVASGGEETLLDAGKLREFMNKNQRSLREVLTPEHMRSLDTITKAAEIEGRVPRATGSAEKPQSAMGAVEKLTGTSIPSAATAGISVERGRSQPLYEGGRIIVKFFNNLSKAEAEKVWKAAIYDPKVAQTVASAVTAGKATPMQQQQLYRHMYMLTVAGEDAKGEERPK